MAKIYITQEDEDLIQSIIGRNGLGGGSIPKYYALRMALAISLNIEEKPSTDFDVHKRDKEYHLQQVISSGTDEKADLTQLFIALISQYYGRDFFSDQQAFPLHLQRLIRRGLHEIRTSWKESHDIHEYLFQEFFSLVSSDKAKVSTDYSKILISTLHELGIAAQITNIETGPRVKRFHLKLDKAQSFSRLRSKLDDVSFSLGLRGRGLFIQPSGQSVVSLDIPKPFDQWDIITSDNFIPWLNNSPNDFILPICLGVDVVGKPLYIDLHDCPHLMVAGTTGAGKSVCLHSIILSTLHRFTPHQLQVCLIDPKRVEFKSYEKISHLYGNTIFTESEDFESILSELVVEMDFRESQLEKIGCSNLDEALIGNKLDLPRIIVFVEELADLIMQNSEAEDYLVRLAQKARSSGIHLVIATQRPDSQTFSGILRQNVPSRIALTVQKSTDSNIILGESGAEKLTGKGDMLVRIIGKDLVRGHGIFMNKSSVENYLRQLA